MGFTLLGLGALVLTFSSADPERFYLPVDPDPDRPDVRTQLADPTQMPTRALPCAGGTVASRLGRQHELLHRKGRRGRRAVQGV